jgi:Na+-driven multidrug efflux pump
MEQAGITASPKLRVIFVVVAAIMFALWGWSLIPPIENWNNPNEDGFSHMPAFYATITCLPVGLYLLAGVIAGRGRHVARARTALFLGGGLLFLVVAFLIFQYIANSMGGS